MRRGIFRIYDLKAHDNHTSTRLCKRRMIERGPTEHKIGLTRVNGTMKMSDFKSRPQTPYTWRAVNAV